MCVWEFWGFEVRIVGYDGFYEGGIVGVVFDSVKIRGDVWNFVLFMWFKYRLIGIDVGYIF